MKDFQPRVIVKRDSANNAVFSYVVEGSAKIYIEDMCGYKFTTDEVRDQFNLEIEEFKSSLTNAPDNFNDNDRDEIKSFVENLLVSYFESGKLK